ncbi:MAG: hypothetical protein WC998_01810 [Candidatus Paceibacterota bacterium]|jgi:hypothetical protein
MEDKEQKLENSVMGKINSGKIGLKSKYLFLAEKLGLGTAFALSVLLSVLLFNLILFYLKETDNLKYLSLGKFGIFAFLESFPYLLVIAFVILIGLSGYLITKSDVSYKKPFGYLAVGLVIFIMIFGGILTFTNLAHGIEKQARGGGPAGMFLMPLTNMRNSGVAGIVFERGDDYLILETPHGLRNVGIENVERVSLIEKGQFVIAVGSQDGHDFNVERIKVVDKKDVPAIGRGIEFKFSPFIEKDLNEENIKLLPSDLLYFDKQYRDCIKICFDSEVGPKDCFKECHK